MPELSTKEWKQLKQIFGTKVGCMVLYRDSDSGMLGSGVDSTDRLYEFFRPCSDSS